VPCNPNKRKIKKATPKRPKKETQQIQKKMAKQKNLRKQLLQVNQDKLPKR
jgi:hypothetical protein